MRTDLLDRYVILYARAELGGIVFDYVDERCNEIECGVEEYVEGKTSFGISGFFAASLSGVLAETLASLPMQQAPHGTGVVPLAVFVGAGAPAVSWSRWELADIGVEALANAFALDPDQLQAVILPQREWPHRSPFKLPLRIGATSEKLYSQFRDTQSRPWYAGDPVVSRYGLTFELYTIETVTVGWPDVLFTDAAEWLEGMAASSPDLRPRLIVACGFTPDIDHPALSASSCLVSGGMTPSFLKALIYALVHDQPLPEMLKSAVRAVDSRHTHLLADPASAQQLRMLHAMQELQNEVEDLEASGYVGSPDESPFELIRRLYLDFSEESEALVPMSRVRAALVRLRDSTEQRRAKLQFPPGVPRQVDITLLRTDARSGEPLYVARDQSVAPGQRYRVKVHIGLRSTASLVTGEAPAIDILLPPPTSRDGHLLHIVCYPLDFQAVGPTIRRVILPLEGPSKAVSFDVIAPSGLGPARLRIAVYYDADLSTDSLDEADAYRNHLIQSFVLDTQVAYGDGTTAVTLEFSRTAGFSRLDQYTGRAASLAVNEDPHGTHRLMIKRGGMHRSFSINPVLLLKSVRKVRRKLFKATSLDQHAQFPRFLDGVENEAAFDDAIRELAKAGWNMRQKIFADPSTDTSTLLAAVAGITDEIVQVVRLDNDFYFPWQMLYDFRPPRTITGAAPPPVCKEFRRTHGDGTRLSAKECLASCAHRTSNDAFCVYGFWGARLQVEQTLHRPKAEDKPIPPLDVREKGILIVSDLHANAAKDLSGLLSKAMNPKLVAEMQVPPDLLTKLWSADRPAVVVVLGHYQTRPVVGEVDMPRIRVPGGWLIADDIHWKIEEAGGPWPDRHSVVIVAACDSAGQDLLTMNGFVTAFAKTRAGAFFGTETTVFEPLARDFARAITESIVQHQTLGTALLEFRRGLLQKLNPLGFVFSGYGDAELLWPEPKGTS